MKSLSYNQMPGIVNREKKETVRCFKNGKRCKICGGIGWVVIRGDAPRECPNYQAERDIDRYNLLISGMKNYLDKTFDTFITSQLKEIITNKAYTECEINHLKQARNSARDYAKKPKGWLVFEGTYGCGKTHLALAICNYVMKTHGMSVLFTTTSDLLDKIRSTFNSTVTVQEALTEIHNTDLLVLDDYGVEKGSEWVEEKLFQLLNNRYSTHSLTIITTNLSIEEMTPRIASRLKDKSVCKYVKIHAPDYREMTNEIKTISSESPVYVYKDMTFETFDVNRNNTSDKFTIAKETCERWANDVEARRKYPILHIYGGYSIGKTHLAAAIANKMTKNKEDVLFISGRGLADKLHSGINNGSVEDVFKFYVEVPHLFLDDLDFSSISKWAGGRMFDILDNRILAKSPTVITAHRDIRQGNERLAARLKTTGLCHVVNLSA